MKILLVEDDEHTTALISNALTAHHYLVNATKSGQTALALTETYNYDLILLDVIVPDLDGVSLCRQLRSQGAQMPILMLTGNGSSGDRVAGLEAGADDYVVKPFDLSELVARIRALLRRRQTPLQTILTWENLQLDLSTCEIAYGGVPLHLTPKEYGLLELFLRNPRRIFNRSALLDNVWKANEFPGERAVTTQIKGLRQKLKTAGMTVDLLETVYGLGYRLRPEPLERLDHRTAAEADVLQAHTEKEIEAAIEKIWQKLQSSLKDTFELFDRASAEAASAHPGSVGIDPDLRRQAILEAHRLAGNLGSFGLPQGSELARQIEQLLRAKESLSPNDAGQLSEWVEALKHAVTQPRNAFKTPKKQLASPKKSHPTNPVTRLLVVDDDVAIAQQIQAAARSAGFEVAAATNLVQARQAFARASFDGVLLDLTFPDTAETGLTFLEELTHQIPNVPVVVLTGRDRLTDRVEVARLGGRAFVQKPILPHKLLETMAQVLAQSREAGHNVLIVDDDLQLLETLKMLLQPWGLQVTTLDDSQQFWKMLETAAPDLLILDVEMPHFNGIDLCQAVRNDPYWGEIPVLFLTAHRDAETIQRVFMAGADDYVSKPIMAPELLARVLNRLERRQPRRPRMSLQPSPDRQTF
ncbi:response regulator [Altericista sp. CCNU0014]|uniref:response regulator n=1 Tax=Altericista sp. CCNU0014 TaxID=3082949 RepID=UPI00384E6C58